jgi:hypothetical protein
MNKARLALIVVALSAVAVTPASASTAGRHETAKNSIGNIR